jgi:uncharacterized protein (TIGR02231 family)
MLVVLFGCLGLSTASAQVEDEFEKRWSGNVGFDYEEVQTVLNEREPEARVLPLQPNSTIESVTVFLDRAQVTRVRTLEVGPEASTVEFVGLPHALLRESLFAVVREGSAEVIGVEVVTGQEPAADQTRREAIKAEMRPLADELGTVRDRIEALLSQRVFLRTALLTPPGQKADLPALSEIKGLAGWLGDSERALSESLRKEEERAKELAEDLEPFLIRLENPLATGQIVRVELAAASQGPATVAIRYQVSGAAWSPAYNARYLSEQDKVGLEVFGVVSQTTGERWDDVALSLSTANPAVAGTLPTLTAWKLTGVSGELAAGRGRFENSISDGEALGGLPEQQQIELVERTGSATAPMVFPVAGKRTVNGDGSPQRIPLATESFSATDSHLTIPKQISEVFRSSKVHYKGNVPLLPGELAAYVDGDFVGTGSLPMVLPGEDFDVAFGTHERLKVERQLVERNEEKAGRNRRYTFHFRTTVRNFGASAETVTLLDQIPVSEVDRIDVKLLAAEGHTVDPTDPPGTLRWTLTVPAGGTVGVDLSFQITAPESAVPIEVQQLMR